MLTKEINIKNRFYNYYFDNLIKAKKLGTKNIKIDEKMYKNLVIYFTRYVHSKSIKIFTLYSHELIGKSERHEGKLLKVTCVVKIKLFFCRLILL